MNLFQLRSLDFLGPEEGYETVLARLKYREWINPSVIRLTSTNVDAIFLGPRPLPAFGRELGRFDVQWLLASL
jgi:hypothetical protein